MKAFHIREASTHAVSPFLLSMSQSKGEVQLRAPLKTAALKPTAALSVQYTEQQLFS